MDAQTQFIAFREQGMHPIYFSFYTDSAFHTLLFDEILRKYRESSPASFIFTILRYWCQLL